MVCVSTFSSYGTHPLSVEGGEGHFMPILHWITEIETPKRCFCLGIFYLHNFRNETEIMNSKVPCVHICALKESDEKSNLECDASEAYVFLPKSSHERKLSVYKMDLNSFLSGLESNLYFLLICSLLRNGFFSASGE